MMKVANPFGAFTDALDRGQDRRMNRQKAEADIQRSRSQQKLADLTLTAEEKKIKRQELFQGVMQNSLNPDGKLNGQRAISGLNQAGLYEEANAIKNRMSTAYDRQQKQMKDQKKFQSERDINLSRMAQASLESKNPVDGFMLFRKDALKKGYKLSPGLMNHFPTDKEIADGGLDPRVRNELDYLSKKSVSPKGPMSLEDKMYLMNERYKAKKDLVKTTGQIKADMPLTKAQKLSARIAERGANVKDRKLTLEQQKAVQSVLENSPEYKALVAKTVQDARGEISDKDKKVRGQQKVTNSIKRLSSLWNELDKMGSALSTKAGAGKNIANRIASTGVMQAIQNTYGGKAQNIRNQISTLKPTLILAIKNANPSIGAKGMDTPAELNFYLSAIGKENVNIESNMAALVLLEESMGISSSIKVSPKIKEEMAKLKTSDELKSAQMDDLKTHLGSEKTDDELLNDGIDGL